ncbi:uncharacterized protein METZ01_LOCUS469097 [marine metagenome]|uniref:Uncharacterized protein n=1 Tax=marine metagenome TaxID=408172 RepID=A0A383B8V2_9ZZZZ
MNYFIIAMIVMFNSSTNKYQYLYHINEDSLYPSASSCLSMISDPTFGKEHKIEVLQEFEDVIKNKPVSLVRLACLNKDKVEEYKVFMKENN